MNTSRRNFLKALAGTPLAGLVGASKVCGAAYEPAPVADLPPVRWHYSAPLNWADVRYLEILDCNDKILMQVPVAYAGKVVRHVRRDVLMSYTQVQFSVYDLRPATDYGNISVAAIHVTGERSRAGMASTRITCDGKFAEVSITATFDEPWTA